MKRIVVTLVLFCLALLAWPVQAQEAPRLSNLEISLWPEYDDPQMLVIYRGSFASGTTLPLPVEIRMPASVGAPNAVAYLDDTGQTLNQPYTSRVEGESLVVSFELDSLGFQLEYYAPLVTDPSGQRAYTFHYSADYAVDAFTLEAQVPATAQNYVLDPDEGPATQQADGLTYHLVDVGPLAQGQSVSWTLTYENPSGALTIDSLAPAATQTPAPVSQQGDNSTVLIFAVAFVALVAVGVGAFWLGKHTQPAPEPTVTPQRKRRGSGRGSSAATPARPSSAPRGGSALFCYRCGAELRPDAEFCHKCGAEVRE
jgi:hypothetical protein